MPWFRAKAEGQALFSPNWLWEGVSAHQKHQGEDKRKEQPEFKTPISLVSEIIQIHPPPAEYKKG